MAVHACVIARIQTPLAEQIWQLRWALQLPGASTESHLTVLPPIVHHRADDHALIASVKSVAAQVAPFRLQVAGAGTFAPKTPVVYTEVTGDLAAIDTLHQALADTQAARDFRYPYIPHVTLAWANDGAHAIEVTKRVQAAEFRGECELDELEVVVGELPDRWETLARIRLTKAADTNVSHAPSSA